MNLTSKVFRCWHDKQKPDRTALMGCEKVPALWEDKPWLGRTEWECGVPEMSERVRSSREKQPEKAQLTEVLCALLRHLIFSTHLQHRNKSFNLPNSDAPNVLLSHLLAALRSLANSYRKHFDINEYWLSYYFPKILEFYEEIFGDDKAYEFLNVGIPGHLAEGGGELRPRSWLPPLINT